LATFLDDACARAGVEFVWLQVWNWNVRAQAVYTWLGFRRYELAPDERERWMRVDAAGEGVWRMRIESSVWPRR